MMRLGTAGWAVPRRVADAFPKGGTGLQRYAARFDAVEINTSFYRPHKPATYARWAESVPDSFRFAVKMPKTVTHEHKLIGTEALLDDFLASVAPLGPKLGPLLVQLPPSLAFEAPVAEAFLSALRQRYSGAVACEPRHPGWFEAEADSLLASHRVARVGADPARVPAAAEPGGWTALAYVRLHGSPRMYFSDYSPESLSDLADRLEVSSALETWCMFDNTTLGAAAENALTLQSMMASPGVPRPRTQADAHAPA